MERSSARLHLPAVRLLARSSTWTGTAPDWRHQWPALGCTPGRDGCTVAVCVHSSEHKSVSNRELCRHYLDAYRPDRLDDLLALLHPDIEWTTTETWVEREVWYGRAGVRAGLRRFFSGWEDFSNDEVEAFSDGGDKFAVVTRMRGVSRGTHIPTEMRTSGVLEVSDGLIVRIVGHSDPADALAAVAKSAAAVSPARTGRSSQSS